MHLAVSLFEVRAKEAILVSMALTLLVCSILLFFKHWKKNYRDINQLPYYAYLYQKEEVQFEPEVSMSLSLEHRFTPHQFSYSCYWS